jgi:hypothetical protein
MIEYLSIGVTLTSILLTLLVEAPNISAGKRALLRLKVIEAARAPTQILSSYTPGPAAPFPVERVLKTLVCAVSAGLLIPLLATCPIVLLVFAFPHLSRVAIGSFFIGCAGAGMVWALVRLRKKSWSHIGRFCAYAMLTFFLLSLGEGGITGTTRFREGFENGRRFLATPTSPSDRSGGGGSTSEQQKGVPRPLIDRQKFRDYVVEVYAGSFEILRNGESVFEQKGSDRSDLDSFQIGLPESEVSDPDQLKRVAMGNDITGDGEPDLVVSEYTGGAHCCFIVYIFEVGPHFRKVATRRAGQG